MIRQQKNAALAPDVAALPMVVSDKPAPASMLARTTSGNVISAPTERCAGPGVGLGSEALMKQGVKGCSANSYPNRTIS